MKKSATLLGTCSLVVGLLSLPLAANAAAIDSMPAEVGSSSSASVGAQTNGVTLDLLNRSEERVAYRVTAEAAKTTVTVKQNGRVIGGTVTGPESGILILAVGSQASTLTFSESKGGVATGPDRVVQVASADESRPDAPGVHYVPSGDGNYQSLVVSMGFSGSISVTNAAGREIGVMAGMTPNVPANIYFFDQMTPGELLTVTGTTNGGLKSRSTTIIAQSSEVEIPVLPAA
jgi:hypothetical protein